jgi:hypothetical protein
MADSQQHPPIARLVEALRAEKIRFVIVGMMSAVIQGAPVVTFDTDIWIDLPARQYMRLSNLCLKLGATMRANTVFVFPDDTMVNFIYAVTGLRDFVTEYRGVRRVRWLGLRDVPVLPLERIYKSKSVIRRPKDLVHMQVLKQLMTNNKTTAAVRRRRRKAKS